MKNSKSTLLKVALMSALLIGTVACMDNKTKENQQLVLEEDNPSEVDDKRVEKDQAYFAEAAEIDMEFISLAKLAQEKENSSHVKELGKMVEDQHTQSLKDLTQLIKRRNMTLPPSSNDEANELYREMEDKSAVDFGKSYSDHMVSEYKDAITHYEKMSTESSDSETRAWAAEALPGLKEHLEHSKTCQEECNKM